MDTIRELNLEQDTLSMFLSDNGPHREICEEGGHPGPFKGSFVLLVSIYYPSSVCIYLPMCLLSLESSDTF